MVRPWTWLAAARLGGVAKHGLSCYVILLHVCKVAAIEAMNQRPSPPPLPPRKCRANVVTPASRDGVRMSRSLVARPCDPASPFRFLNPVSESSTRRMPDFARPAYQPASTIRRHLSAHPAVESAPHPHRPRRAMSRKFGMVVAFDSHRGGSLGHTTADIAALLSLCKMPVSTWVPYYSI